MDVAIMTTKREIREATRGENYTPQRHGTSTASTLPVWITAPGEKRGTLNITCPRRDCGGKAVVSRKWLTSRPGFIGRSCTYCFKVARLP